MPLVTLIATILHLQHKTTYDTQCQRVYSHTGRTVRNWVFLFFLPSFFFLGGGGGVSEQR